MAFLSQLYPSNHDVLKHAHDTTLSPCRGNYLHTVKSINLTPALQKPSYKDTI